MNVRRALIVCLFLNFTLRFVALDQSPPAFFHDEARAAAHAICLAESGRDASGQWLPLYSPVEESLLTTKGGGLYPATWTYPAAVWSKTFGTSRTVFRSLSVFASILAILLLYLLIRMFAGETAALLGAIVFAYMPASIHLGRLAWENSLIPFLLLAALFCFFRSSISRTNRSEWTGLALTALFLNLAAISYPAQRLQLLLLIPVLLWARNRQKRWDVASLVLFLVSLLVFATPLMRGMLNGYLLARFDVVSIFNEQWLLHYRIFGAQSETFSGWSYWIAATTAFTWKFLLHFSPKFLFFSGDVNTRHSPQFAGELGFLEAVAILYLVWKVFHYFLTRNQDRIRGSDNAKTLKWLCAAGIIAGIIPSALTQNSPHALRTIGAFPFVAIWAGLELAEMFAASKRRTTLVTSVSIGAFLFAVFFFCSYFRYYPEISAGSFHQETLQSAAETVKAGDWKHFVQAPPYERDRMARAYYAMSLGNLSCEEVRPWIRSLEPQINTDENR